MLARDPSGNLGIQDVPHALLAQAAERTRGFPRALEALARSSPPTVTPPCPSCSPQTTPLPDNVVESLVGEAFQPARSARSAVMQALRSIPTPVPPVAIDYLLQPYLPAVDSRPGPKPLGQHALRPSRCRPLLPPPGRPRLRLVPDPPRRSPTSTIPIPCRSPVARAPGAGRCLLLPDPYATRTWRRLDDLSPLLPELELRYSDRRFRHGGRRFCSSIDDDYLSSLGTLPSLDLACMSDSKSHYRSVDLCREQERLALRLVPRRRRCQACHLPLRGLSRCSP